MTTDEILALSDRLASAGANRAKKLGVKTDPRSLTRLIHERRKTGGLLKVEGLFLPI